MADQLLSATTMYYWYIFSVFHVKMLFDEPQSCADEIKIRYLFYIGEGITVLLNNPMQVSFSGSCLSPWSTYKYFFKNAEFITVINPEINPQMSIRK